MSAAGLRLVTYDAITFADLLAGVAGGYEPPPLAYSRCQCLSYAAAGGASARPAPAWPPAHILCASSPVAEKISSAFSP